MVQVRDSLTSYVTISFKTTHGPDTSRQPKAMNDGSNPDTAKSLICKPLGQAQETIVAPALLVFAVIIGLIFGFPPRHTR